MRTRQVVSTRKIWATRAALGLFVTGAAGGVAQAKPKDIGTLGGDYSHASDINEKGQVVGDSINAKDELRAFIWKEKGKLRDLGTLGGKTGRATAINGKGDVVGSSNSRASGFYEIATLWPGGGKAVNLGVLSGDNASQANDINDAGLIVGKSGNETPRAVL